MSDSNACADHPEEAALIESTFALAPSALGRELRTLHTTSGDRKNMRTLILTALALAALSQPSAVRAQEATAERAAIQRLLMSYAENVQSGNLAAVEPMFAQGAHILTGVSALHSWAEYRENHLRPETQRYTGMRYTHSGVETTVRGNVAWSNFRWQMAGSGETPAPTLGRGTAVLEKVNGSWVLSVLHFSK